MSRVKAYQCAICDKSDADDLADKRFCHAGLWPHCGNAKDCREAFKLIEGKGRIGVHR